MQAGFSSLKKNDSSRRTPTWAETSVDYLAVTSYKRRARFKWLTRYHRARAAIAGKVKC
jgi:hypothetical protein